MKIVSSLVLAVAALTINNNNVIVDSAPADTCEDQAGCIEFNVTTLVGTECIITGDCPVEVCMMIKANHENEHGKCTKMIGQNEEGRDGFSHVCMQSNLNGCTLWEDNIINGVPIFGIGDINPDPDGKSTECSLTGDGTMEAFDGKCNNADDIMMCQEGSPGDILYWIVKDGNSDTIEPINPLVFEFEWHDQHGCNAIVECSNHNYTCGDDSTRTNNNGELVLDPQAKKERTWAFRIPESEPDSVCDVCDFLEPPIFVRPTPSPVVENQPPSGGGGDPHFKTWKKEHFQYHGQCDLVMAKDEDFADGLGLDLHVRTKLVRYWSYIKNAVIRIGNDILEIEGSAADFDAEPHYWINYEYQGDLETFAGFPVHQTRQQGTRVTKNLFEIDLSSKYPGSKIVIGTFKEFIKVDFVNPTEEAFGNTVGMLGDFKTGKTVARDGITELGDFTDFGREWQVLPKDGKLFRAPSYPEFPELCIEPENPQGARARRLDESGVSLEQAELACASLKDEAERKDCVYDILATQDLDMVGAF